MSIQELDLSQKQINKIGKNFRDSVFEKEDIQFLEEYRKNFDNILINLSNEVSKSIKETLQKFVLVGRLKRIYSIIRKLQRKNNYGMDLTRMSDIAGIRVIVKNIEDQEKVLENLKKNFKVEKIYDYRNDEKLYTSIHLIIIGAENKLIEIQIRTLAQQAWADESESFGEQVKFGKYTADIEEYLRLLNTITTEIDQTGKVPNKLLDDNYLYNLKSPIQGKFGRLSKFFDKFSNVENLYPKYYLVVFDSIDNSLVSEDIFSIKQKEDIFNLYKYKTKILNEDRFEIVFFISTLGKEVLRISHPRFYAGNQYV
jgi:ppGpp synthetase/RelA/SpoT-type nucleotidyltranferase